MKTITTLTAKPLNYAIIKSDKSKTGEFIKITFLVEKEQDDKGNYYGSKKLDVLEVFDTYSSDFEPLTHKDILEVKLTGLFVNYKYSLTGFEITKREK